MSELKRRSLNVAIALDQLLWVFLTLGNGSPDETISAALWRMERSNKWQGRLFRPLVDALFFFDKNHCRKAWLAEFQRKQLMQQSTLYQVQKKERLKLNGNTVKKFKGITALLPNLGQF